MIENVESINNRRQAYLRKIFIGYLLIITFGLLFSWYLNEIYLKLPTEPFVIIVMLAILFFVSYHVVWFKVQKIYTNTAKTDIMKKIILDSNYDLKYQPESKIKLKEVFLSRLFSRERTYGQSVFDTEFILTDYFYGTVNSISVSFCEVYQYHNKEVRKFHESDGSQYIAREEVTDFNGIFYKITLPESYSESTTLLTRMKYPDDMFHRIKIPPTSSFTDVSSSITKGDGFYLLDEDEMDSYFKITSSSKKAAQNTLTESLIVKLKKVRKVIGNEFGITIHRNALYLAKPYKEGFDLIEPHLLKKVKVEQINDTIEMIDNSERICEILTDK